jgi:hypothetical protein
MVRINSVKDVPAVLCATRFDLRPRRGVLHGEHVEDQVLGM